MNAEKETTYTFLLKPTNSRSPIWDYMGFPANDKHEILMKNKVVCSLCSEAIAYSKNTTNLHSHLAKKHPRILVQLNENIKSPEATSPISIKRQKTKPENSITKLDDVGSDGDSILAEITNINAAKVNSSSEAIQNTPSHLMAEEEQNTHKTQQLPHIMKRFLSIDLISPSIVDGNGFKGFIRSLLPISHIPTASEIETFLKEDHERLFTNTPSKFGTAVQQKFSLLINRPGGNRLFEYSFCVLNETHLECQTLSINEEGAIFLNKLTEVFTNCCIVLVNFELLDNEAQSIKEFFDEKRIPIIQTLSCVFELAMLRCIQLPHVKKALRLLENKEEYRDNLYGSFLGKFDYFSSLLNNPMSNETANEIRVIQSVIKYLQPLKDCLIILASEETTYASIMKPIAQQLINQHYIFDETKDDDEAYMVDLKRSILDVLNEKIISNKFLTMASFLDPRFTALINPDDLIFIRNVLESSLNYIDKEDIPEVEQTARKGLSLLFANNTVTRTNGLKRQLSIEFQNYVLNAHLAPHECPLTWWKDSGSLYPNLINQVGGHFCVPAFVNRLYQLSGRQQITLVKKYQMIKAYNESLIWLHLSELHQANN